MVFDIGARDHLYLCRVARPLVIVESPAKARTIAGFLGDDFVVESSVGHIRDLEPKGLGVDVDNGFKPTYVVYEGKKRRPPPAQEGAHGGRRALPRDR